MGARVLVGSRSFISVAGAVLKPSPSASDEQWRMDPIWKEVSAIIYELLAFGCECHHTARMES